VTKALRIALIALTTAVVNASSAHAAVMPLGASAPSAGGVAGRPLIVGSSSHVVAIEYEAWFGPHAVPFQNAEARPWLQSTDMQPVGGGYDSADPAVIEQHVRWLEYMSVDAATLDLTNNVGCIFSTGPVSRTFCDPPNEQFRQDNRNIRDNDENLYRAWTALKTRLKLIPLTGCQTWMDVAKDADGTSGFQKEVEYFGRLMREYPGLDVSYEGRPRMLVYTGTPMNVSLWHTCKTVLATSGLSSAYTFRFIAGYLDSQPSFWENPNEQPHGPIEIAPRYGFWSVVDRYKPSYHYYPTYDVVHGSSGRPENLTVSIATAGQSRWGCPQPAYCPDDALRYAGFGSRYVTLDKFMEVAGELRPTFLIVDQFNEFAQPDEGWNPDTSDDAEPTRLPGGWAFGALQALHDAIYLYRR